MSKKLLFSTVLAMAGLGMASTNVRASESFGIELGAPCTACHTHGADKASRSDVKPAAQAAFDNGGLRPGLADFVASLPTPTPVPGPNTKPRISEVQSQWDVQVGQELSIPISVADDEDDTVIPSAKPLLPGAHFGDQYTGEPNGLPTFDYLWTPSVEKVNKLITLTFMVQEKDTKQKFKSKPLKVKVRVWPEGDLDQAKVQKVVLSTAKWVDGKLSLKGKVQLNKLMSAAEKTAFLDRDDFIIDVTQGEDGYGLPIVDNQPITFDAKGNWTLDNLTLVDPFDCFVSVDFEGAKAARKIAGAPKTCLTPKNK